MEHSDRTKVYVLGEKPVFRHSIHHKSQIDWPGKETRGSTRSKALPEAKLKWWDDAEE
jgi:hypothetical protein